MEKQFPARPKYAFNDSTYRKNVSIKFNFVIFL